MGLKVEGHFLLLTFVRQDRPDEQHESIWGYTVVQLETLLGRRDGGEHRETINTGLDVGCRTVLLREHGRDSGDLILGAVLVDRQQS